MSLIVCKQAQGEVLLVGDTKFTYPASDIAKGSKQFFGGLKCILLSPGLAIGFAGEVEFARDAIEGIYSKAVSWSASRVCFCKI